MKIHQKSANLVDAPPQLLDAPTLDMWRLELQQFLGHSRQRLSEIASATPSMDAAATNTTSATPDPIHPDDAPVTDTAAAIIPTDDDVTDRQHDACQANDTIARLAAIKQRLAQQFESV